MNVTIIDAKDNVAVAIEPIVKGDRLEARGADLGVTAKSDVTIYHKVAIRDIPKGQPVVKYGEHIGLAAEDIPAGTHVHTHNVENHREAL
ncbi:MAG: UxaA family hydrolase [Firmicutes bacterium]|nr:UxaA family hydrolase [Bacillota bacterium]